MKHTPRSSVSPEYIEETKRNIFSDNYEGDRVVIMHTVTIIDNTMEILRITPQVDILKVIIVIIQISSFNINCQMFRLMRLRLTWKLSSLLTNQTAA